MIVEKTAWLTTRQLHMVLMYFFEQEHRGRILYMYHSSVDSALPVNSMRSVEDDLVFF